MSASTLRTRPVYHYWLNGEGIPISDETITYQLTEDLGFTDEDFIPQRDVVVQTDGHGLSTALLWCDEDSNVAINWRVQFPADPNVTGAVKPKPRSFSLAYGDGSAIPLGTLVKLGIPVPDETMLLYQAITDLVESLTAGSAIPPPPLILNAPTARVVQSADIGAIIRMTNASASTITLNTGLTASVPAGKSFSFLIDSNSAAVTWIAGGGVTITPATAGHTKVKAGGVATVFSIGANSFKVVGATE